MRIVSYNLNGIRSAFSKGLIDWIATHDADLYCFQEIKADVTAIPQEIAASARYPYQYWFSALKKGYSGVGIISRHAPVHVEYGCGHPLYDSEGRVIRIDFKEVSILCVYMPSGTTGNVRQEVKNEFLVWFKQYAEALVKQFPALVICGDFNIAHTELDIHNSKSNVNTSGFLPHERAWLDAFFGSEFDDAFRILYPDQRKYSWWSFRAGSRARNVGWRIDYHAVSKSISSLVNDYQLLNDVIHSDHCPIELHLNIHS